ncbi:MAG: hypothetical protein HRT52_12800 [Colwellia sp.]|nr:hypothetical protein [Colwellia sp.]
MNITREKPCQRRHHRLKAPLHVSVNGLAPLPAFDWSLGGLCVGGYQGDWIEVQEKVSLILELPFQGFQISFDVSGVVIRNEQSTQSLFIEFVDLPERSFDLMNHFVDDLIRGKMATIDDTICRIDVPVTPISTSPTPNPTDKIPLHRIPIKTIMMSFFYISLGLFVFGYLALIFYSNLVSMEIATSVVSSRIQTMSMPVDGILKPINLSVGARYKEGEPLFGVENINLKNKINSSKLKIEKSKIKLSDAKEKYRIETERMKLYQIVSNTDLKIIEAQLAAKRAELAAADRNFARINRLKENRSISTKQLDDATQVQNKVAYQVQALEAKLVQATAMESVSERRHYNHKVFSTDLDLMAVNLQTLYSAIQLEEQQLALLIKTNNQQIVRAPYNGKVTTLFHVENSSIPRNEAILMFEETGRNLVTAFLNQEEVMEVGLHDIASVFIPALGFEVDAIITQIDRASGYVDKKNVRYAWRDKEEKTALVSLELLVTDNVEHAITAGLPAVVIFKRRTTSNIFAKFFTTKGNVSDKNSANVSGGSYDSI